MAKITQAVSYLGVVSVCSAGVSHVLLQLSAEKNRPAIATSLDQNLKHGADLHGVMAH
jgi:hypothetical protein